MMNNIQNFGAQQARDIPMPPGGGSWTFDEIAWKWVSNDPAPAEQVVTDEPVSELEQPVALTGEE